MKRLLSLVSVLALLTLAIPAYSQVVKFNAATTTGNGAVTPVLTWCTELTATSGSTCGTSGPAQSCTASGSWTGTQPVAGTATLAAIQKSATYVLTCSWSGGQKTTVQWTPPTQNVDGSSLANLSGFVVNWGTSATTMTNTVSVPGAAVASTQIGPLSAGSWFGCVAAVNSANVQSVCSNPFNWAVTNLSAAQSVSITVNAQPNPPTNVVFQ